MVIRASTKANYESMHRAPRPGASLMIYGRPTFDWDGAPSAEDFYKDLGYGEVHSIDVSDYQGATFIHDLNDPHLPEELRGKYDVVLMGGTIEHVFNLGLTLRKAADLVKVGGTVDCSAPVNNWVDHGFYQVCPTLKFDFFGQNGFDLGMSQARIALPPDGHITRFVPIYPGEAQLLNFVPARVAHTLLATKTPTSTTDRIPLQSAYSLRHGDAAPKWCFQTSAPFDLIEGAPHDAPMRRFRIQSDKLKSDIGCWKYPFRHEDHRPSLTTGRHFKSNALVYEDGVLLPWIVSDVEMIAAHPGSFKHEGGYVHFSSRDGSDPRENGRAYDLAFPLPFDGVKPYAPLPGYD